MRNLNKNNVDNILRLTPVQEGLLFHYLMEPASQLYHAQLVLELEGSLDPVTFNRVWNKLVEKHEMLRTLFRWEGLNNPIQVNLKNHLLPIRFFDLSTVSPSYREQEYAEILDRDRNEIFSLDEVPFRVTLCTVDEHRHYMLITHHHILYDGWSTYILLKDFFRLYGSTPESFKSPMSRGTYRDYVKVLAKMDKKKEEAYWSNYLKRGDSELSWFITPRDKKTSIYLEEKFIVDSKLQKQIEGFLRERNVLVSSFFYFVYGAMLKAYQNVREVTIGYTLSSRGIEGNSFEDTIGLFINTLPLRIDLSNNKKILDVIEEITQTLGEQREVCTTPLVDIKKYSNTSGELFNSIIVIENYPADMKKLSNNELQLKSFASSEQSNYPLTIGLELFDAMEISLSYDQTAVDPVIIQRMGRDFLHMLEEVAANLNGTCDELSLISSPEKRIILEEFNKLELSSDASIPLFKQFEKAAHTHPSKIAIRTADGQIDYMTLNAMSDSIARSLSAKGIVPGSTVLIFLPNSIKAVAAMLGVQKAGLGYVPIDIFSPEERVRYILNDCRASCVITGGPETKKIKQVYDGTIIDLTDIGHSIDLDHNKPVEVDINMDDTCYIIYTSGTSGNPKGVMVSHKNVASYVQSFSREFAVHTQDVVLQQASLAFDASVEEIFPALVNGGEISILGHDKIFDIHEVHQFIRDRKVSIVSCSPLLLNELNKLELLKDVRLFISGGDVLKTEYIDRLKQNCTVYNSYGPTEATVCAAYYNCAEMDAASIRIPIGKPIDNAQIYIVDTEARLAPIGVPGELCIAGLGVAKGYVNLPRPTAEKFTTAVIPGQTLYKTGDRARWLPGGNIDFMGRMDNQVSIRGYRIELEEVEATLRRIRGVVDAIAIVNEYDDSRKRILAFYKAAGSLSPVHVREELIRYLPDFMVPAEIKQIEKIPFTLNGKVDYKKLMSLDAMQPEETLDKFVNDRLEKELQLIWKEILGQESIGLEDNFFDVGGNSIILIQLNNRINRTFGKNIKIGDLFQYTTIRRQAQLISGDAGSATTGERLQFKAGASPDIAVIGMAGRLPAGSNIYEIWDSLATGVNSISVLSQEELDKANVNRKLQAHPNYVKSQGVMEGIDLFDPDFFGYKPNEAMVMDPQIRIFHEVAWEALEDAGYDPGKYHKPIGIFAEASPNLYWEKSTMYSEMAEKLGLFTSELYSNKDYMSQLVAYKLGLTGPAVSIYTACSTSLVAVHTAAQSILRGECSMALAGSVTTVPLPDKSGYLYEDGMILSEDGLCKSFDNNADGFIPGKGSAVVVLKRLEDALADHDHIYAVIKGTAINNDGARKVGYNAPSVEGIAEVIREALRVSEVPGTSISYMETHGAATKLGDLIEIEAASQAFNTEEKGFCAVGSIKTNIGHLDCTSGIAGLVKTVLMLKNKTIAPSLHFNVPNLEIDLIDGPFYVASEIEEFPDTGHPLRASVNSIGQGGTNAHVILEEAPPYEPNPSQRSRHLILVSAMTEQSLQELSEKYIQFFKANDGLFLGDIAYTLQVGRKHFNYRKYVCCSNLSEGTELLQKTQQVSYVDGSHGDRTIYFVFGDDCDSVFQQNIDYYCSEPLLKKELEQNILIGDRASMPGLSEYFTALITHAGVTANEQYNEIINSIFLYSYARMLISLGVKPAGVVGCGNNELIALCLAGVLSFENVLEMMKDEGRGLKDSGAWGNPVIPYWSHTIRDWYTREIGETYASFQLQARGEATIEAFVEWADQNKKGWTGILNFSRVSLAHEEVTCINSLETEKDPLNNIPGFLWSVGYAIDWEYFGSLEHASRVSLPTYSFKKESYWLENKTPEAVYAPVENDDSRKPLPDWFYVPAWRQSLILESPQEKMGSSVLILCDESEFSQGLIDYMNISGYEVIAAFPGNSFALVKGNSYQLNLGSRSQYKELLTDISRKGYVIQYIVNGLGLSSIKTCGQPVAEDIIENYFLNVVYLADAVQECNLNNHIKLISLTASLHRISGGEVRVPEKSLMIGASMVAAQEISNLSFQCLELDEKDLTNGASYPYIEQELRHYSENPMTAYRNNIRWELDYRPIKLEESVKRNGAIKEGGVYLVVGGLGGVGFHLCQYLLKNYKAKLIITGRTAIHSDSGSSSWDAGIAHRAARLNKLQSLGSECTYVAAGVHNREEMEKVFEMIDETYSSLNGVIFAPASSDSSLFRSLHELTKDDVKMQFHSKVEGVQVLAELIETRNPDFCLLMSSISSVVGGLGFAAYSSANIYLDYFAGSKSNSRTRWISVNWEGWDIENKETRFDYNNASVTNYFMSVEEGIEAMERVLALRNIPQVAVSSVPLSGRLSKWVYKKHFSGNESASAKALALHNMSLREIEDSLGAIVKDYFGFDDIKENATFFDMGASSLDVIQLCLNIRKQFNISLTIVELFRYSSVVSLAEHLLKRNEPKATADGKKAIDEEMNKIKDRKQRRLQKSKR
ncbi:amino acid adenylation domain-containing protein [Paenibacillus amylolyticus]|uniref:amino acid adenylation domain-containing protein n=1 Tax=Paenibacillus amylolyticus TaxID=1451 RepID=UPI003EC0768E